MLLNPAATIKKMRKNTISGQLPFPFTKTKLKTHNSCPQSSFSSLQKNIYLSFMNKHIDWIKRTRQSLLQLVEGLTIEQLNEVPSGFNNNIIWNLAHLVAVQQGICYKRSGVSTVVDEKFIAAFTRGKSPNGLLMRQKLTTSKMNCSLRLTSFSKIIQPTCLLIIVHGQLLIR